MRYLKIKNPGNYPVAKLNGFNIIWENQDCSEGQEFEEWQIDTAFMNQEDFEEVNS